MQRAQGMLLFLVHFNNSAWFEIYGVTGSSSSRPFLCALGLGIELHVEFPGWVAITTCEIVEGVVRDCDFVMKLRL